VGVKLSNQLLLMMKSVMDGRFSTQDTLPLDCIGLLLPSEKSYERKCSISLSVAGAL
jgi:hypothetical protein